MTTTHSFKAPARSGRDAATRSLLRRLEQFPDMDFHVTEVEFDALEPRERRLAHAIDQATVRHWLTIVHLLQVHITRPWPELELGVRAALMTGATQLFYFDKIPAHAVINESVEWAKRHVRPKAAGLVNAVLRRTAELRTELVDTWSPDAMNELPRGDGSAWRLAKPVFPEEQIERLALTTSHPLDVAQRWVAQFGSEVAVRMMQHNLVAAPTLIAGTPSGEPDLLAPHDAPGTWVFRGHHDELEALLASNPELRVQDPTTALSVASTADLAPMVIIDACAGRGTKTGQLADLHPNAQVIATDIDDRRRAVLHETWDAHDRVTVVEPDTLNEWAGKADLLVLDVPCSNSGVLARRVEARYRLSEASIAALTDLQRQILADTLALCAPNACVLYATCSIDQDENDGIADWLLKWHPFEELHRRMILPSGLPGDGPSTYSDGGFHALLRRRPGG